MQNRNQNIGLIHFTLWVEIGASWKGILEGLKMKKLRCETVCVYNWGCVIKWVSECKCVGGGPLIVVSMGECVPMQNYVVEQAAHTHTHRGSLQQRSQKGRGKAEDCFIAWHGMADTSNSPYVGAAVFFCCRSYQIWNLKSLMYGFFTPLGWGYE